MLLQKLHHVAYRCRDARQTVDFYTKVLGMKYALAVSAERVPSINARCPYMHVFFELGDGSYIAFFEVPEEPPMGRDTNTPEWVQHLALEVKDLETLTSAKAQLERHGVTVVGPTSHGFIHSIYFFDPSGHRLEMTVRTEKPGELEEEASHVWLALDEWDKKKRDGRITVHGS